jgi:hypothetical protein
MTAPRTTDLNRLFDSRGEPVGSSRTPAAARLLDGPERVELPLAAWRRRARPQANVITLRIPSWASSSSKP